MILGVEGVNRIWREAKLKAVGLKRPKILVDTAEHSIGIRDGTTAARIEIRMFLEDYESRASPLQEIMNISRFNTPSLGFSTKTTCLYEEVYILHKMLDENYMDLLIDNMVADNLIHDYNVTRINERYSILHSPIETFDMCSLGYYPYHIFPTIYTLSSTVALEKSGVSAIQSNPNFELFGQGVLIGFVDTGINYQHQAFLNPDGSSRIVSIWDQSIINDAVSSNVPFGTEYDKEMINIALMDANPLSIVPSVDEIGHGTMLAGIAAGSIEESQNFQGVAPQAELIVVKLVQAKHYNRAIFGISDTIDCYSETNIIIGIDYIKNLADKLKRPVVICVGLGSSQGDHDGHSALALYLNNLSTIPRIGICVSAGNEGNRNRHYSGVVSRKQSFSQFELRVGDSDKIFSLELWQKSPGRLDIKIQSPTGEETTIVRPQFRQCYEHNFIFSNSRIYINNIIAEEETGEQLILVRFSNAMSGIWKIQVFNRDDIDAQFNAWLPSGNIITEDTFFLEPDPYTTITSPGNARNPITVAAYNQMNNSILINSSRGNTSSGGTEPDIAAPGFNLMGPNLRYAYGNASGTGAAAAHTAGIISLIMEWSILKGNYTTISGRDINRLLIRGAARDDNIEYPNRIWGYGRIDILGLFSGLI
ncbi:S8 family peptidase [Hungatella effluvii]|uniref:S8 family peptidase n=1 Tax=Hungatella effluvii TaxID=1096246 RepID=UPI001FA83B3E|nr:S8 family peptidase [Hungatella effluvii]